MPSKEFAALRRRASDRAIPLYAQFEVTHRCNLRCRHCYLEGHHEPAGRELTLAEVEDVLDQLADLGTLFLTFTGGEFFVREDAFDLLAAARARGFACTVLTNGTLLDAEGVRRLAGLRPFQVHLTLLGTEAVHDRITGQPGSFVRTVSIMDGLRAAGVRVVAKLVITRLAVQEAEAMEAIATAHADSFVRSVELFPTLDETPVPDDLIVRCEDFCCLPRPNVDPARPLPPRWPAEESLCSAGRGLVAVSPYGEVFPCIAYRKPMGQVREDPLAAIWQGAGFEALRRLRRRELTACTECPDQPFCTFCPGRAWHECGDERQPAPSLCARARRVRTFLEQAAARAGDEP